MRSHEGQMYWTAAWAACSIYYKSILHTRSMRDSHIVKSLSNKSLMLCQFLSREVLFYGLKCFSLCLVNKQHPLSITLIIWLSTSLLIAKQCSTLFTSFCGTWLMISWWFRRHTCHVLTASANFAGHRSDQFRFLGNCPPTPPLTCHLAQTWELSVNVSLREG